MREVVAPLRPAEPDVPIVEAASVDALPGLAAFAPTGTCGRWTTTLRLSTDGGRTWQAVEVPAAVVLRIAVSDPQRIWLVGADQGCRERVYHTLDGGRTWHSVESTAGAWYRPTDPSAGWVHAPHETVATPCAGERLTEVSGITALVAAARCQDGTIRETTDGGHTWPVVRAPGPAVALAYTDPATLYVLDAADTDRAAGVEGPAGVDGAACAGRPLSRRVERAERAEGGGWERVGCVPDPGTGGPVALCFTDPQAGLLVSSTATYVTADGGRTWQRFDAPPRHAGPAAR
jgi:photosystem II stability/assembly factor-like uncharacterized protein